MERRLPSVGDVCIYHDERGRAHNALITCVWGPHMINVVFVSSDEKQQDDYGRQTKRESSVNMWQPDHEYMFVHGRYARWPEETPVVYKQPEQQ